MKKIVLGLLCAAMMWSCNSGGVSCTITVSAPEGVDEVILVDAGTMNEMAVLKLDEGAGVFTCKERFEAPFIGGLKDGEDVPMTIVFVESGDIYVDFDEDDFVYIVSGTPSNDAYTADRARFSEMSEEFMSIVEPTEEQAEAFQEEWFSLVKSIIAENSNIYGAYMLDSGVTMSMEPAEILECVAKFPASIQESYLASIKQSAEASLKVAVGSDYTEIVAPDAGGVDVALSSVVGSGKWVLVDFWATWCGPCRGELPYLKEAYEKYADRGFEIYGVSLDNNIEAWKAFVDENGMNWVNVADIREDRTSPAADAYGIRSIPSNFLISPEGKIVARDLRGEGVEEKLAEIF